MKVKFKIIFFLMFVNFGYSQVYNCNVIENQIKTYEFVLKNFDIIKKTTKSDLLLVSINFNEESSLLENITFYNDPKVYEEPIDKKYEVSVSFELENFIIQNFGFCPAQNFDEEHSQYGNIKFRIPLIKKNLLLAIEELNKSVKETSDLDSTLIEPDANFSIQINKIKLNNEKVISFEKPIQSVLKIYNSQIIKLSKNYFLTFRVLKTSELNINQPVYYLEHKLFYVLGRKSYVISKESNQRITNNIFEIEDGGKIYRKEEFQEENKLIQDIDIDIIIEFKKNNG